jgi:hypothetical protein
MFYAADGSRRAVTLWAWLLVLALLIAACGKEAPPRADKSTLAPTTAAAPAPQVATQPGADPRALGDPNAPITMIEYGDYQ